MSPEKAKKAAELVQAIESSEKWGRDQRSATAAKRQFMDCKRAQFANELAEMERPILLAEAAEIERVAKVAVMRLELEML